MLAIGCDHGGVNFKALLMTVLKQKNIPFKDFGCFSADAFDYPDVAQPLAEAVARGEYDKGILICGTGIGMSIAANKVPGIRCAHCHDVFSARATRKHNNANIMSCGERVIGAGLFLEIVDVFLNTEFEGGRHQTRVDKITDIEKKYAKPTEPPAKSRKK